LRDFLVGGLEPQRRNQARQARLPRKTWQLWTMTMIASRGKPIMTSLHSVRLAAYISAPLDF
jgi:hypothetical protein